ncbi:8356_t:CDS:1, partial [Rhizophagus irregularis]
MAFAFRSYFSKKVSNVGITVVRIDQKASQPCKFVHFNLSDNLSKVRLQLEKRDMIDSTLSFARKFIEN